MGVRFGVKIVLRVNLRLLRVGFVVLFVIVVVRMFF